MNIDVYDDTTRILYQIQGLASIVEDASIEGVNIGSDPLLSIATIIREKTEYCLETLHKAFKNEKMEASHEKNKAKRGRKESEKNDVHAG